MLGYAWLARGRVETARRCFREGATLLRDGDAVGMRPWALAGLAQAAAQAGDADGRARRARARWGAPRSPTSGFGLEVALARAWTAAAEGELSRARALALEGRRRRGRAGRTASRCARCTRRCRLGAAGRAPAGCDRRRSPRRVEGPFAPLAAAHAAARRRARALLDVAERFAGAGLLLVAAEAAGAAGGRLPREGREASARRAEARAAAWLRDCEGARPPTLRALGPAEELTPREREVALLAAGGLSSAEIAERLVVSVRTVDNHLQRAYGKLGIGGRHELADALG